MTQTRAADDPTAALAALQREVADLRSTALSRADRRPVGTIESTIATTGRLYTLDLNGQTLSRTAYAELWAWAQAHSDTSGAVFGPGDGSTTFTLPDFAGRVPIGRGVLGDDGYEVGDTGGAARVTLDSSEMPEHTHDWSGSWGTTVDGAHSGHRHGVVTVQSGTGASVTAGGSSATEGGHNHGVDLNLEISPAGAGLEHENRPPFIAVRWVIWW